MSRYARRTDSSHRAIVLAFRALGCSCAPIQSPTAGLPDLAVGFAGKTHLVEVKPDSYLKAHETTPAQKRFALAWRGGFVNVVRSPQHVAELVATWRQAQLLEHRAAQALAKEVA